MRLIDGDSFERVLMAMPDEELCEDCCYNVVNKLDKAPTIEAEPVVRRKDCRHWRQEVSPTEHWVCAHHSFNERKMYTTPDFYCADGEREDEDASDRC